MGLPVGVFSATGDTWKAQRRMVMHGFDPTHVRRYFPSLQGVAQRLVGRWQKAAAAGTRIDLQADLMRYTVDTIAGLAFGAAGQHAGDRRRRDPAAPGHHLPGHQPPGVCAAAHLALVSVAGRPRPAAQPGGGERGGGRLHRRRPGAPGGRARPA
jgi:cytochrome P450